jgi:hypothetical protein
LLSAVISAIASSKICSTSSYLSERAADAHRELEGRRSVGAIVLTG